ncbi:MAG: ASCH domain-containing protein [Clostridiales bacterium]|jgi:hypothetical protein|nr:ASCH domain-containing protein [Clostridiales bacterium]
MKTINFKPEFIPLIRAGKKTQTRRPWASSPHAPKYGGLCVAAGGTEKTVIRITRARRQNLNDITEHDVRAEGFEILGGFISVWQAIYGGTEFDANNNPPVWAYEFEFVADEISHIKHKEEPFQ